MLASERSSPPNQIGRRRRRSLTTIRQVSPLRIVVWSIPMAGGPGVALARELRLHVFDLQGFDGVPVERQFLRYVRD
jgi:hypothetical protein